jgi:hypothetical protein
MTYWDYADRWHTRARAPSSCSKVVEALKLKNSSCGVSSSPVR